MSLQRNQSEFVLYSTLLCFVCDSSSLPSVCVCVCVDVWVCGWVSTCGMYLMSVTTSLT